MRLIRHAPVRPGPDGGRNDSGVTMVEVTVSMVVMSIAMTIFTTAFMQVFRTVNKTESLSTAQSQVTLAFQRLDREVRYASGISTEGQVGQNYFVEYLLPDTGAGTCVELRLQGSTAQLQRRTWPKAGSTVTPTVWVPLVSWVTTGAQPFQTVPVNPTTNFNYNQSLMLSLTVTSGNGAAQTARVSKVTFTAQNTNVLTSSATLCTEGRVVP